MPGPQTIETGYAPIKAWVEGVLAAERPRGYRPSQLVAADVASGPSCTN
jgi:hypothetical protein